MNEEWSLNKLKRSRLYSEDLGIDLSKKKDTEYFKWFLASILFGNRISEEIAAKTYGSFEKHNLLSPDKVLEAGWDFLVDPVMREGKYVRYDEKTSAAILRICESLKEKYHGSLKELIEEAADENDLEQRLQDFYGIGPVTTSIFLRELRPYIKKVNPEPPEIIKELAKYLEIDLEKLDRHSVMYARLEAGLMRNRKKIKKEVKPS